MNEGEILEVLRKVDALVVDSHIVYASGRHGSAYVNKDALYLHAGETSRLCNEMARLFNESEIDVVAGPTIGGVILSQWVAHHLTKMKGREILSVFAEEDAEKNRLFKRGYDKFLRGRDVLVVEDILTTGGSVKKLVEAVKNLGGNVVGCAAICNRGGVGAEDVGGAKIKALVNVSLDSWEESECPLCKKGAPVNTSVGKGREYLERKKCTCC